MNPVGSGTKSAAKCFFSEADSLKEMKAFEKAIAYKFGVEDESSLDRLYIQVLKELEKVVKSNETSSDEERIKKIYETVLPKIEAAYQEIGRQRGWKFNIKKASEHELNIIVGNAQMVSHDEIVEEQTQLYQTVFNSDSPNIRQAAMLRVGLYQYKIAIQKSRGTIPMEDRQLMVAMARRSEKLLNSVLQSKEDEKPMGS